MRINFKLLLLIPFALFTEASADDYYSNLKKNKSSDAHSMSLVENPASKAQIKAMHDSSLKAKKAFEDEEKAEAASKDDPKDTDEEGPEPSPSKKPMAPHAQIPPPHPNDETPHAPPANLKGDEVPDEIDFSNDDK